MENIKKAKNRAVSFQVTEGESINVSVVDGESGRRGYYSLRHTRHSLNRSNQRGIDNRTITAVLEYGKLFQKQGLEFYVLGDKCDTSLNLKDRDRAKNTLVVVAGEQIVTCYKGRTISRHIKKKSKYLSVRPSNV